MRDDNMYARHCCFFSAWPLQPFFYQGSGGIESFTFALLVPCFTLSFTKAAIQLNLGKCVGSLCSFLIRYTQWTFFPFIWCWTRYSQCCRGMVLGNNCMLGSMLKGAVFCIQHDMKKKLNIVACKYENTFFVKKMIGENWGGWRKERGDSLRWCSIAELRMVQSTNQGTLQNIFKSEYI